MLQDCFISGTFKDFCQYTATTGRDKFIGCLLALVTILLSDYFILKNKKLDETVMVDWGTLILCAPGTALCYQFIKFDFLLGATIPVMLITGGAYVLTRRLTIKWKSVKKYL